MGTDLNRKAFTRKMITTPQLMVESQMRVEVSLIAKGSLTKSLLMHSKLIQVH